MSYAVIETLFDRAYVFSQHTEYRGRKMNVLMKEFVFV
jgi:hypothetical protein